MTNEQDFDDAPCLQPKCIGEYILMEVPIIIIIKKPSRLFTALEKLNQTQSSSFHEQLLEEAEAREPKKIMLFLIEESNFYLPWYLSLLRQKRTYNIHTLIDGV